MSERYQRILVALDASARARGVLATAVDLARRLEAKLVLFRAVGLPPARELEAMDEAPEKVPEMLEHHAEHDLEALARDVPPELLEKVSVHLGAPWQAICRAAQHENAQLIVLGSHGYGGLDRILGTTAAKVVNHADRSVLVVRDPAPMAGGTAR
jgi:nucleotide-binding universal stress UspA family protein